MNQPILTPALTSLLQEWLPRQRWFPVKTAEFSFKPVGALSLAVPPRVDAEFEVWLLAVTYPTADGNRRLLNSTSTRGLAFSVLK